MGSEEAARAEPRAPSAATFGWVGRKARRGLGKQKGTRGASRCTSSLKGAATEVALRTKELTHRLYRWPGGALEEPAFTSP